jgi:hypothetical protein
MVACQGNAKHLKRATILKRKLAVTAASRASASTGEPIKDDEMKSSHRQAPSKKGAFPRLVDRGIPTANRASNRVGGIRGV